MSSPGKKSKTQNEAFSLEKLSFYFDQVERDRMDALGSSYRTKDVMQIRNQLLTLPEGQFLPTLSAIKSILKGQTDPPSNSEKTPPKPRPFSQTTRAERSQRSISQEAQEPPAAAVHILQNPDQENETATTNAVATN